MKRFRLMKYVLLAVLLAAPTGVAAESLVDQLLRIAGITASPGQMRSEETETGSIWIANLERGTVNQLTPDSNFRSPVFSPVDGSIFTLTGDTLVRLFLNGAAPEKIQKVPGAIKLVGFDSINPDEIVILLNSVKSPLGVLSLKEGKVRTMPYDAKSVDQQRILAQIRNQDRAYGPTNVYLKTERKQGISRSIEWTDVYVRRGNSAPRNVSQCGGINCAQPSLSPDGRLVAFVRTGE